MLPIAAVADPGRTGLPKQYSASKTRTFGQSRTFRIGLVSSGRFFLVVFYIILAQVFIPVVNGGKPASITQTGNLSSGLAKIELAVTAFATY